MADEPPERILVVKDRKFGWPHGYTDAFPADPEDDRNPVEYVRADLYDNLLFNLTEMKND